jgi:putative oxidoreductase
MQTLKHHFHSPKLGLFLIRLVAGAIFIFHGVQKLSNMEGTIAFFASLSIGAFLAWVVALVELLGGISLVLGIFPKFFGTLLAIIMVVAILKVKLAMGFAKAEIDLMLLAVSLSVVFSGCGRYSICGWNHKDCNDCKGDKCGCEHIA